mmetsp:Transcript_80884/g.127354  ORF Transcript_80884/g.127354 Transcript_80884/m.127354 type:complete len:83 (-) Transcript_80884:104-352(-)
MWPQVRLASMVAWRDSLHQLSCELGKKTAEKSECMQFSTDQRKAFYEAGGTMPIPLGIHRSEQGAYLFTSMVQLFTAIVRCS